MLHSEPNNWEIFKIPPIQPIQYYSILNRKREFSQLIKQYDAQVRKHDYLHYCSIVPKSIRSSLNDEYELLIVFLGDVPSASFIGFRVNVNSETFIQESNSLLLFLKQSKKAGLYFVNKNYIYVQCEKDAWEIFYHLYEIYMRKYVLTVIGTQFFNHFVYQVCFQNEVQLLNMLFRGSKVIRVSKMSIYYRMYQKHKISVTDLIHMTLNMPESKRFITSFDCKESSHLNMDQNIYRAVGTKISVSKLVINKFIKCLPDNKCTEEILENVPSLILNFHSNFVSPEFKMYKDMENKQLNANSSVLKRKFEETEKEFRWDSFFSKFPKISDSNCLKEVNCWEQYASLKPYSIKSYSSLLPSKSIIPDIFYCSKSSHEIDSLCNLYFNNFFSVHNKSPCVISVKKYHSSQTVEESDIHNVQNLNRDSQLDGNSINASCFIEKKLMNSCQKNYASNDSSKCTPNQQLHHPENLSLQSLSYSKSTSAVSPSIHIEQGEANAADDILVTAAGKSINISSNAILAAQRFIQGILQNETRQKLDSDVLENKQFIKVSAFKRNRAARNSNDDEITSGERDSTANNYELSVSYDRDSFYTAAGKTIKVSNAAMKAAQKLIQDAFDNDDNMPSSSNTSKIQTDMDSPSKKLLIEDNDDTMDKTFVEKFFQDAVFDEKEEIFKSSKDKDFHKVSKKNNEPTSHKIRKSLGGRRSLRFYSDV